MIIEAAQHALPPEVFVQFARENAHWYRPETLRTIFRCGYWPLGATRGWSDATLRPSGGRLSLPLLIPRIERLHMALVRWLWDQSPGRAHRRLHRQGHRGRGRRQCQGPRRDHERGARPWRGRRNHPMGRRQGRRAGHLWPVHVGDGSRGRQTGRRCDHEPEEVRPTEPPTSERIAALTAACAAKGVEVVAAANAKGHVEITKAVLGRGAAAGIVPWAVVKAAAPGNSLRGGQRQTGRRRDQLEEVYPDEAPDGRTDRRAHRRLRR